MPIHAPRRKSIWSAKLQALAEEALRVLVAVGHLRVGRLLIVLIPDQSRLVGCVAWTGFRTYCLDVLNGLVVRPAQFLVHEPGVGLHAPRIQAVLIRIVDFALLPCAAPLREAPSVAVVIGEIARRGSHRAA